VRPGARYRCFGDGLCCTDIHAIGPIGRTEVRRLEVLTPGKLVRNEALAGRVVAPRNGGCSNLGPEGCSIHAAHGLMAKPSVCRRFPYRLVVTPAGRRVSTEHRCPCRTMGDRPPLEDMRADIVASLRDQAGRMSADVTVGGRVLMSPGRRVLFSTYERVESELLARLSSGDDALEVLDVPAFPALDGVTWIDVAHHYRGKLDGSACGDALAWFGDIVLSLADEDGPRRLRQRPWSPAFDRAEARTSEPESPAVILADWVADEVWGLEWTEREI
jgi:hypothetical protein